MKNIIIFIVIFLFSIVNANAQNLSKAYDFIETHEFEKAKTIINKNLKKRKNVIACRYGLGLIYSNKNYHKSNNFTAYSNLFYVKKYYIKLQKSEQIFYSNKYGITKHSIDSLTEWILNTEYIAVKNNFSEANVNKFLDKYTDTKQAKRLSYTRDSIRYHNCLKINSLYSFSLFIANYPNSEFIPFAIQKRDSLWDKTYHETYSSLEIFSIKEFEDRYPDYPNYDATSESYKKLAKQAWNLKMHYGYLESTNYYYGAFIAEAAPSEMALQALLILLQKDLLSNNKKNAIDTVLKYQRYFGNDDIKIKKLLELLNKKEEKLVTTNIGSAINTSGYEYMPVVTIDGQTMYFCGEKRPDNMFTEGEDIFMSKLVNGKWSQASLLTELSTAYKNEAPLAISPDGNTMLVFSNGDVFMSEKTKTGWSKIKPIKKINTSKYWEADAVMSADGKAILFVSDRHGNVGSFHSFSNIYHGDLVGNIDIYVITKTADGWSEPINLGSKINTPYAERTPFLHPDMKTLYFSSDGYAGFGKMDVYKSVRLSDTSWTEWSEPENLGYGINSPKKEYGYKISTDGTKAFFTYFVDNHADIYSVPLPEEDRPEQVVIISGAITNLLGEPLQAEIIWENLESGKELGRLKSDPQTGHYIITLPLGNNYGFYVSKDNYYPLSDNINLKNNVNTLEISKDFKLIKIEELAQGTASIELKNLFFEFNKYTLQSISFPELNRLGNFLINNQNIKIEISGHTDNKGSASYNKELSERRAEEVMKYLIGLGCKQNQITTIGYGDSKPVASNKTETGRQQNRRVEFKVIK